MFRVEYESMVVNLNGSLQMYEAIIKRMQYCCIFC